MLNKFLITILLISFSLILSSQVFWSEDFANGIPSDWEIEELSNFGVTWTYCPDTTLYSLGSDNTCPHNFDECDDGNGFQKHFKSETPENGYATCVLEPFISQLGGSSFTVSLTTDAIDCSKHTNVFVIFNSHIGVNSAEGNSDVQLRVSTDKLSWTPYFPHRLLRPFASTLPGIKRWSKNSEKIDFDISDVAAGEEEIYIQWRWTGRDEYHWSIDDIKLSTETSVPAVDISLRPTGPYHALMTNYRTPVSQIDTAFFITDIGNVGSKNQSNIAVIAQVIDENNVILYSDTIKISELDVNDIIEEVSFRPYFHEAGEGKFRVIYKASPSTEDARKEDNYFEYPFIITQAEFEKNETTKKTIRLFPQDIDPQGFLERNWSIANHFYVPNGENYFVDSIQFEIPNRDQTIFNGDLIIFNDFDITLPVRLYEWTNSGNLDLATSNEYTLIGRAEFIITGALGSTVITTKLTSSDNSNMNIPLKNDQHYFLAIDYSAPFFNKLFYIKASTHLDYDATIRAHELKGRQRFASMNKIGSVNSTYNTFSFGGDVIPHIGFSITEDDGGVSTDQVFVVDGLRATPNPVSNMAQIKFNLDIKENDKLELSDINGQLIKTILLSDGQGQYELDCSRLQNANYLLTYKSEKVISSTKLVVLH